MKTTLQMCKIYKSISFVIIFGSISKSNFWRVFFLPFFDLIILPYSNEISMNFYAVKCLIYIYFR